MSFFAVAGVFFLAACEKDDVIEPTPIFEVDNNGNSRFNLGAISSQINNLPKENLSAEEEAGLIFMREEEKLAHDVYFKLYETYGIQIFSNIAASEETHTATVLLLIDKYDLTDPVGENTIGIFSNSNLQMLYDSLIVVGNSNEMEALKVGAAIEEIDILDLENQLNTVVDNQDIELVYQNLQKGSRNHLRAFVKNLSNRGVTYEPQYLPMDMYLDIINGDMETGG
jgi:hypothetical protein